MHCTAGRAQGVGLALTPFVASRTCRVGHSFPTTSRRQREPSRVSSCPWAESGRRHPRTSRTRRVSACVRAYGLDWCRAAVSAARVRASLHVAPQPCWATACRRESTPNALGVSLPAAIWRDAAAVSAADGDTGEASVGVGLVAGKGMCVQPCPPAGDAVPPRTV